jgi:hypothetical protein
METVAEPGGSPRGPARPTGGPALPALPWVPWGAVPPLPRYYAPLRRPPAPLGSLRFSLASRYHACCTACVVSSAGSWPGGSAQVTPGPWGARSPTPAVGHGDRWFSHGLARPLGRHAPRADPGGGLRPCHTAPRTAACRRVHTVGLCRAIAAAILLSTTLPIAGLQHAACRLAPSSCVRPWLGWHVACAPDRLARRESGGT